MSDADQVSALLGLARDSLEDAKTLARRGRRNASLLVELALRQALSAISVSEGLEASETLGLETLLRRVPAVHPQAELVRGLSETEARTMEAVGRLVAALSKPAQAPKQGAPKRTTPKQAGSSQATSKPVTRPAAPPRPSNGLAAGPTAFESSPHGLPRHESEASATSAAFWALMDRWRIADLDALALIGHAGGLTKNGTRPRFRLVGPEAERYAALRRIDTALEMLGLDPDWLHGKQAAKPFSGRAALAVMVADMDGGIGATIRFLDRQGLRSALTAGARHEEQILLSNSKD